MIETFKKDLQPNGLPQPELHKKNVISSSFIDVVFEMDKYAVQLWTDKSLWSISNGRYNLCVRIEDKKALVAPCGYGSCQNLIAVNPDELRENIKCWWRNR